MIEKTSATSCSDMDIKTAAKLTTAGLGYSQLKVKQLKVICDIRQRKRHLTCQTTPLCMHMRYARVAYAIIAFHCVQLFYCKINIQQQ